MLSSYGCTRTGVVLQFVLSSLNADELLTQDAETQALVQSVMGHGQWPSDARLRSSRGSPGSHIPRAGSTRAILTGRLPPFAASSSHETLPHSCNSLHMCTHDRSLESWLLARRRRTRQQGEGIPSKTSPPCPLMQTRPAALRSSYPDWCTPSCSIQQTGPWKPDLQRTRPTC